MNDIVHFECVLKVRVPERWNIVWSCRVRYTYMVSNIECYGAEILHFELLCVSTDTSQGIDDRRWEWQCCRISDAPTPNPTPVPTPHPTPSYIVCFCSESICIQIWILNMAFTCEMCRIWPATIRRWVQFSFIGLQWCLWTQILNDILLGFGPMNWREIFWRTILAIYWQEVLSQFVNGDVVVMWFKSMDSALVVLRSMGRGSPVVCKPYIQYSHTIGTNDSCDSSLNAIHW